MYSFNIDWFFNKIYDFFLWIKFTWNFNILGIDPEVYLRAHEDIAWDGLRDRGWLDELITKKQSLESVVPVEKSFAEHLATFFGVKLADSDGDGVPNVSDPAPWDPDNTSVVLMKERYYQDYSTGDNVREFFGFGPKDSDGDGVPDSYEIKHGSNHTRADTDNDGLLDGRELLLGTDITYSDSDRDGLLDGRDPFPVDAYRKSLLVDTDGDGLSDDAETGSLKTNPSLKDTDNDGIQDGMDTFPLDRENFGDIPTFDPAAPVRGVKVEVQNPVFEFVSTLFSVMAIIGLFALAVVVLQFIKEFWTNIVHYEHHFEKRDHAQKAEKERSASFEDSTLIPGLAVMEEQKPHPKWQIVVGYMSSDKEPLWRIGILEADMILAEALKEKGYAGTDVGELLKAANFSSIDLAWNAHKVRNRIAHDGSDFVLTEHEAKKVLSQYETVFRELKVI